MPGASPLPARPHAPPPSRRGTAAGTKAARRASGGPSGRRQDVAGVRRARRGLPGQRGDHWGRTGGPTAAARAGPPGSRSLERAKGGPAASQEVRPPAPAPLALPAIRLEARALPARTGSGGRQDPRQASQGKAGTRRPRGAARVGRAPGPPCALAVLRARPRASRRGAASLLASGRPAPHQGLSPGRGVRQRLGRAGPLSRARVAAVGPRPACVEPRSSRGLEPADVLAGGRGPPATQEGRRPEGDRPKPAAA
jgi:hypothetical protein